VAELRRRALPPTFEEVETNRKRLVQRLAALERALAVRSGAELTLPLPTAEEQALTPGVLNDLARSLVGSDDGKRAFGQEARALILAQLAWEKARSLPDAERAIYGDTLAWAWFANGKDEEALRQSESALALAPAERRTEYEGYLADLSARVAAARGDAGARAIEILRAEMAALEAKQTFVPADEAQRFLHETLVELRQSLDALAAKQRKAVEQRLRWAHGIVEHRIGQPLSDRLGVALETCRWRRNECAARRRTDLSEEGL
jgi:hypothetical protein